MRILFIRLSDTTDVINALPAVTAFKRDRPDSWIVFATFPGVNSDIVESCQAVGEVLAVPDKLGDNEPEGEDNGNGADSKKSLFDSIKKTAQKTLTGAKATAEFVKRLQDMNLDAVVDLQVSMRSALIARNSRAALISAFRSENAANKKAAMAYANAPYVNPSLPDFEKYNLLIANSLGTSTSSHFDWSLPQHDARRPSERCLQIIPTGLIDASYWCGALQQLLQQGIAFRIINCALTDEKVLSRISSELSGMSLEVAEIEASLANELVGHGGPVIGDGAAAYLSLALGLNTLAIGEKPTSPFIAPAHTFYYTYPGPKDLPYPEQFVQLATELLGNAPRHDKIADGASRPESPETDAPADAGLDMPAAGAQPAGQIPTDPPAGVAEVSPGLDATPGGERSAPSSSPLAFNPTKEKE